MSHSIPIEVDGIFVGAAVRQERGVRFIATDLRVAEMDQTFRPTAEDVLRAACCETDDEHWPHSKLRSTVD